MEKEKIFYFSFEYIEEEEYSSGEILDSLGYEEEEDDEVEYDMDFNYITITKIIYKSFSIFESDLGKELTNSLIELGEDGYQHITIDQTKKIKDIILNKIPNEYPKSLKQKLKHFEGPINYNDYD